MTTFISPPRFKDHLSAIVTEPTGKLKQVLDLTDGELAFDEGSSLAAGAAGDENESFRQAMLNAVRFAEVWANYTLSVFG